MLCVLALASLIFNVNVLERVFVLSVGFLAKLVMSCQVCHVA